jgi:hypothetical protein
MESEIYTPELEIQLIQYYHENTSKYFDNLKPFTNYTDELKDLLLGEALAYCESKKDKYIEFKSLPINFFSTILKRIVIVRTAGLVNYLDSRSSNHQYQVELNGDYWKGVLTRAKREYDLKNLLCVS